jgi:hypothetical protein
MSQRSRVIHDFQSINLGQTQSQLTDAGSAITITPQSSGDLILLSATGGSVITLPAPIAGITYRFVVNNIGAHTLTAPTACINGAVANAVFNTGSNLATGTAKRVVATTTGSAIGDTFTLMGTDSKYFLSGNVSNFNAIKFV